MSGRLEISADGWERLYISDAWTPVVDSGAVIDTNLTTSTSTTEIYHFRLYRGQMYSGYGFIYEGKGLIAGAALGVPSAFWYTRIEDITAWPNPVLMAGPTASGIENVNMSGISSSSENTKFVYSNMSQAIADALAGGEPDRYTEPQTWFDNSNAVIYNGGILGSGYYGLMPRHPIEVWFCGNDDLFNDNVPQWASGCTATVSAGAWYEYQTTIPFKVDILSQDGVVFKTFDLHFYDQNGPPPLTTSQGGGAFTTVFEAMPDGDTGYTRLERQSGSPNYYPGHGGSVTFTYNGRCGGFRVREGQPWDAAYRYPNDANHIGIGLAMWGKKVSPLDPPLRWIQRNDGSGLWEQSDRLVIGTGSSSIGSSNRMGLGNNTYE